MTTYCSVVCAWLFLISFYDGGDVHNDFDDCDDGDDENDQAPCKCLDL